MYSEMLTKKWPKRINDSPTTRLIPTCKYYLQSVITKYSLQTPSTHDQKDFYWQLVDRSQLRIGEVLPINVYLIVHASPQSVSNSEEESIGIPARPCGDTNYDLRYKSIAIIFKNYALNSNNEQLARRTSSLIAAKARIHPIASGVLLTTTSDVLFCAIADALFPRPAAYCFATTSDVLLCNHEQHIAFVAAA